MELGLKFKQFQEKENLKLSSIADAISFAQSKKDQIKDVLIKESEKQLSSDEDIVVFGSIARGECNDNSDVDWTLLIDGQASPDHRNKAHRISNIFEKNNLKPPGTTGIFGNLAFSHDLIHLIGGNLESYNYLTQRILLLLESSPIILNDFSGQAYERVIRGILNRYLEDDSIFESKRKIPKIPRFLMNDIVRFWRTMCVDFAWKEKEQEGKKWAIRNIKLRFSRKLIFVAGLLMLYECYLFNSNNKSKVSTDEQRIELIKLLLKYIEMTPLDILVEVSSKIDKNITIELLELYNHFLAILSNKEKRLMLEQIKHKEAYSNHDFLKGQEIGNEFQKKLEQLFFDSDKNLTQFIRAYGVF
jgi:predicted nucleotidyltransferase